MRLEHSGVRSIIGSISYLRFGLTSVSVAGIGKV